MKPLYVISHNIDEAALQSYGANLGVMPSTYSESALPGAVECVLAFRSESDAWRWLGVGDADTEHSRAMRAHWRVRRLEPQR